MIPLFIRSLKQKHQKIENVFCTNSCVVISKSVAVFFLHTRRMRSCASGQCWSEQVSATGTELWLLIVKAHPTSVPSQTSGVNVAAVIHAEHISAPTITDCLLMTHAMWYVRASE